VLTTNPRLAERGSRPGRVRFQPWSGRGDSYQSAADEPLSEVRGRGQSHGHPGSRVRP